MRTAMISRAAAISKNDGEADDNETDCRRRLPGLAFDVLENSHPPEQLSASSADGDRPAMVCLQRAASGRMPPQELRDAVDLVVVAGTREAEEFLQQRCHPRSLLRQIDRPAFELRSLCRHPVLFAALGFDADRPPHSRRGIALQALNEAKAACAGGCEVPPLESACCSRALRWKKPVSRSVRSAASRGVSKRDRQSDTPRTLTPPPTGRARPDRRRQTTSKSCGI